MTQLVIDASAFVELLLATEKSSAVLDAVDDAEMVAPDLMAVEVLSVLRRLVSAGALSEQRAASAVDDFAGAPVQWLKTTPLLHDAWDLRNNVNAYDACYVALAKKVSQPLITSDTRLAHTPALGIDIITV